MYNILYVYIYIYIIICMYLFSLKLYRYVHKTIRSHYHTTVSFHLIKLYNNTD